MGNGGKPGGKSVLRSAFHPIILWSLCQIPFAACFETTGDGANVLIMYMWVCGKKIRKTNGRSFQFRDTLWIRSSYPQF